MPFLFKIAMIPQSYPERLVMAEMGSDASLKQVANQQAVSDGRSGDFGRRWHTSTYNFFGLFLMARKWWTMRRLLMLGASLLLAGHTIAKAQMVYTPLNAITSDVRYQGMISSLNSSLESQILDDDAPSPETPSSSFTYRYSPQRTQQNLRNFIARTPDPAARANLEQALVAQPALMNEISAAVRAYGFDPHSVADAYAVWWINVWGASRKQNIEPDPETVEAVKRQVRSAFAATPDFAEASDAERQEFAESLLLQAAMLGSALDQWEGDAEMLEQLAVAARQGTLASGLDLAKMTLTPDGFVSCR
jgi:hypothetical protein